jgi:hypothetical protein
MITTTDRLADKIPFYDLPAILDGIPPPKELAESDAPNGIYRTKSARLERGRREVGSFYEDNHLSTDA